MKSQEDIEKFLEGLGKAWPDDNSIVKHVVQKIESTPVKIRKSYRMLFSKRKSFSIRNKYIFSRITAMILGIMVTVGATVLWICVSGQDQIAFAQVIEKVQQTRSLTFKAKVEGDIGDIDSEEQKWIV